MYQVMFYGGLAGTFIFLIASVVLFIKNDVLKRIGDLTGHNAKKAIEELNKKGSQEVSKTKAIHPETSKILIRSDKTEDDKVSDKPAKVRKKHSRKKLSSQETMDVSGIEDQKTELLQDDATELLAEDATEPLAEDATELLAEDATELLQDDATELLAEDTTELLTGDDATELLYEEVHISTGGFNSILNGAIDLDVTERNGTERTDISRFEEWEDTDDAFTTVLADHTRHKEAEMEDIDTEEISSMPAIFQVEEDVTIVHTEDRI